MIYLYHFRNEEDAEVVVTAANLEEAQAKASPACPGGMTLIKRVSPGLARKDKGIRTS